MNRYNRYPKQRIMSSDDESDCELVDELKCHRCEELLKELHRDHEDFEPYSCDLCDRAYCEKCQDTLGYTFYHCNTCDNSYCFYDSLYAGYYSCRNKRGNCIDCGC